MKRIFAFVILISPVVLLSETDVDIKGDFISEYRWDSRDIYPNNSFNILRARPKLSVEILENMEIEIAVEVGKGVLELKDALVTWEYDRYLGLGAGRRRKPFGIEELVGLWDGPSLSYTELHDMADEAGHLSRDVGFWGFGKLFQEPFQIEYDFGAYNGHNGIALTSEKQFAGRLVYSPATFIDLTGSFSTGLDTLGLDRRSGFAVGAVIDTGAITIAGEYISGRHIVTDEEVEGYQLWTKVDAGRFSPFIQYENSRRGDDDWEKTRFHLGTAFLLKDEVKLRLQATQVADKDEESHTEISMSIFARF